MRLLVFASVVALMSGLDAGCQAQEQLNVGVGISHSGVKSMLASAGVSPESISCDVDQSVHLTASVGAEPDVVQSIFSPPEQSMLTSPSTDRLRVNPIDYVLKLQQAMALGRAEVTPANAPGLLARVQSRRLVLTPQQFTQAVRMA